MKYQLVELGADVADYFAGFGVGVTPFTHTILGQGASTQEAYDDLYDQLYEIEGRRFADTMNLPVPLENWELSDDEIEAGWQIYIGLRYNGDK